MQYAIRSVIYCISVLVNTLYPRLSIQYNTEESNLHEFELHRPSSKGTKLLFHVIKATINKNSSGDLTVLTSLTRCESVNTDQRNGSETKKSVVKKKRKKYTRRLSQRSHHCWRGTGLGCPRLLESLSQFTDKFWVGGNHGVFAAGGSRDEWAHTSGDKAGQNENQKQTVRSGGCYVHRD